MRPGGAGRGLRRLAGAALAAVCLAGTACAEPIALHRGVGVAGWLSWSRPGRSLGGTYAADPWAAPARMSPAEARRLRGLGFDFVRLAVDPGPFLAAPEPVRRRLFVRAGRVLRRLQAAGLAVVWDFHPDVHRYGYDRILTPGGDQAPAYRALVARTARFLESYRAKGVALELVNEPVGGCTAADAAPLIPLFAALQRSARQAAPGLTLIVEGGCAASIDGLETLSAADFGDDPDILFSFHFYEPTTFALQGERGSGSVFLQNLGGVPYPASGRPMATVTAGLARALALAVPDAAARAQALAGGSLTIARYYALKPDRAWIDSRFARVAAWARRNRVSPGRILLGEFGADRLVDGRGAARDDRARWIADVRGAAQAQGFAWSFWAYFDPTMHMTMLADAETRAPDPWTLQPLGLMAPSPAARPMVQGGP